MLILLVSLVVTVQSQSTPRLYLFQKADSLKFEGDFKQSRYYYKLSLRQGGEVPSDEMIKKQVISLDSTLAYQSDNRAFLELVAKADSLFAHEKYIEAMKFFDDASSLDPGMQYPYARIDQILEESDEIKKKLLIYNAKQNQLNYQKLLLDIEKLESEGYYLEAYYRSVEFAKVFHSDSLASHRAETLYEAYADSINAFEKQIKEGEELYSEGNYQKAKASYESALKLNPICQVCDYRLEQIDFCIQQDVNQSKSFETNLTSAKSDFKKGNYEKAYYQFSWLQKQRPDHVEVGTYVKKIEELLAAETDERMRKFNADLTLEKANELFLKGMFSEALDGYLKLKNAYANDIDYLQFVELRIAECVSELEE